MPHPRSIRHVAALLLVTAAGACQAIAGISDLDVGDPDDATSGGPSTSGSTSTAATSTSTGDASTSSSAGDGGAASTSTGQGGGGNGTADGGGGAGGADSTTGSGGGGGAGGDGPTACSDESDCTDVPPVCMVAICDGDVCGTEPAGQGITCEEDAACDGEGNCVCEEDADCTDPAGDCVDPVCDDGVCRTETNPANTGCVLDGGGDGFCSSLGVCQECVSSPQCADQVCMTKSCTGGQCVYADADVDDECTDPIFGAGFCDDQQVCIQCRDNGDCDDVVGDCVAVTCDLDSHLCVSEDLDLDAACTVGGSVCNDSGDCVECNVPDDCPTPGTCRVATCSVEGACGEGLVGFNDPCDGGVCDAEGDCVECLGPAECTIPGEFCATDGDGVNSCIGCSEPPPAGTCTSTMGCNCMGGVCQIDCAADPNRCGNPSVISLDTRNSPVAITCTAASCDGKTIKCEGAPPVPPDPSIGGLHDCIINCPPGTCSGTIVDCNATDGRCIVNCAGGACDSITVNCGANACNVNCESAPDSTVACQSSCDCVEGDNVVGCTEVFE